MCLLAFAFTFVPSTATCRSFTSPASRHSFSTSTNNPSKCFRCTRRNSLIVVKYGCRFPVITRNATFSWHARSIRRDEYTPVQ